MLKNFYLFLFVWLFCITLTAQTKHFNQTSQYDSYPTSKILSDSVQQEWVERYNGPGSSLDYGVAIATDDSGNVYVTGSSDSSVYASDYATIKYNSLGVEEWVARYNGPGNGGDDPCAIAVDKLGNVYVTGSSAGLGSTYDYATIKYSSSGTEEWIERYNGPGNGVDNASDIAVDDSGNVYVTGSSDDSSFSSDYATIKYNPYGTEEWVKRYNGPSNGNDYATALAIDDSGNVYITGNVSNFYVRCATVKYSQQGVEKWAALNDSTNVNDIVVDNLGNVYVTGYHIQANSGYRDYATFKYNSDGMLKWIKYHAAQNSVDDEAKAMAIDSTGNIYVTGFSIGPQQSSVTIKYNTIGQIQWVAQASNGWSAGKAIAIDGFGNVYVTGHVGSVTNSDYATIKYDVTGNEEWKIRYNGPGNNYDYAFDIAVDDSCNVFVTGSSYGSDGTSHFATIKYRQIPFPAEVNENLNIPLQFNLEQNYPNPFNPTTKISWQSPVGSWQTLKVYDVLGREVATLVNEYKLAGKYEVEFNGKNLPSGIYFYKLQAENFIQTKKMILLK